MELYNEMARSANRNRTGYPPDPKWLVWHARRKSVSMPFTVEDELPDHAWHQVMEMAFLGYTLVRVGDTLHITGLPLGFEGGVA